MGNVENLQGSKEIFIRFEGPLIKGYYGWYTENGKIGVSYGSVPFGVILKFRTSACTYNIDVPPLLRKPRRVLCNGTQILIGGVCRYKLHSGIEKWKTKKEEFSIYGKGFFINESQLMDEKGVTLLKVKRKMSLKINAPPISFKFWHHPSVNFHHRELVALVVLSCGSCCKVPANY